MTSTFERDPDVVKLNHHTEYLGQTLFISNLLPGHPHAWGEAYRSSKWHLHPSSHLATSDMGRKFGGCALLGGGAGSPSIFRTKIPDTPLARITIGLLLRRSNLSLFLSARAYHANHDALCTSCPPTQRAKKISRLEYNVLSSCLRRVISMMIENATI